MLVVGLSLLQRASRMDLSIGIDFHILLISSCVCVCARRGCACVCCVRLDYGSDIPVTETQTDTEMIFFSKTRAETNAEMIFNTDTL